MKRNDICASTALSLVLSTPLVLGQAHAASAAPLHGCTAPVPGLASCTYKLMTFNGKTLPQLLKATRPDAIGVTKITGGLLRFNTTTQGLKSGEGDYALQWTLTDSMGRKSMSNDVGTYTLDGTGHLVLTSVGKTRYQAVLKGMHLSVQNAPLETAGFSGSVALEFATK